MVSQQVPDDPDDRTVTYTLTEREAEYAASWIRGEYEDHGHLMQDKGERLRLLAEKMERQFKRQAKRKVRVT